MNRYLPAPQVVDMGLLRLGQSFRERIGVVLTITVICGLAAYFFSIRQTPVYRARATLEVQGQNENFANMRELDPGASAYQASSSVDSYISTLVNILKSDSVADKALKQLTDGASYKGSSHETDSAIRLTNGARPHQEVLQNLQKRLQVRHVREGNIIEVVFESEDPKFAAAFVNALGEQFIDEQMQSRWRMAQRTADWLGRQLEQVKGQLEKSEAELQAYTNNSGLLMTDDKHNIADAKLAQIQQELSTVQADRMAKESQFRVASRTKDPDALAAVLDHGPIRDYQQKLIELRRQLADMMSTLTPENYKVRKLQAQTAEIEAALGRERGRVLDRISNDYEAARARETMLLQAYARQTQVVTDQQKSLIRYKTLAREVESNRTFYDSMLGRMKSAAVASALRASNVRVVDAAPVPIDPAKPNVPLNLGIGLMGGLLMSGIVVVVGTGNKTNSLDQPGQALGYLSVPELGAVPSTQLTTPKWRNVLPSGKSSYRSAPAPHAIGVSAPELKAWNNDPSFLTDCFQAIVTSLLFASRDRCQVLVITSPHAKDGKTTILSNLGIALAQAGQKVLLIDADSRAGRLSQLFGSRRSLRASMDGAESTGDELESFIEPTSVSGLSILVGADWEAGAAILRSNKLRESFRKLRSEHQVILVDTPPMLLTPTARIVGRMADGVVLVLRAGKTSFDAALACKQRLSGDGVALLGTILNDWKADTRVYSAYYAAAMGGKA